jgi:hypothetical protein
MTLGGDSFAFAIHVEVTMMASSPMTFSKIPYAAIHWVESNG